LRLVSDVFPTLMSYILLTVRLLSLVLSGWISILTVKAYGCHLFREVYCSYATCRSCILCHIVYQKKFPFVVICWLDAVYFIHVALVLLLLFIWLPCFDSHVTLICVCVCVCVWCPWVLNFWTTTQHQFFLCAHAVP